MVYGLVKVLIIKKSLGSGRAGREGPGKCYHPYPESEFEKFEDSATPEIKRCDLSSVILQLKALGIDDIPGFDFIEKPNRLFWPPKQNYLQLAAADMITFFALGLRDLQFLFHVMVILLASQCLVVPCFF